MHMPFDSSAFNFGKVKSDEVLMQFLPQREDAKSSSHQIVVNVSPLEFGHVLLVPSVTSHLPQVLTLDSLRLGIELLLLSSNRFVIFDYCGRASSHSSDFANFLTSCEGIFELGSTACVLSLRSITFTFTRGTQAPLLLSIRA